MANQIQCPDCQELIDASNIECPYCREDLTKYNPIAEENKDYSDIFGSELQSEESEETETDTDSSMPQATPSEPLSEELLSDEPSTPQPVEDPSPTQPEDSTPTTSQTTSPTDTEPSEVERLEAESPETEPDTPASSSSEPVPQPTAPTPAVDPQTPGDIGIKTPTASACLALEIEGFNEFFFQGQQTKRAELALHEVQIGRVDPANGHWPHIDLREIARRDPSSMISRRHARVI
ncbi:MAG: hypothetical protein KDA84_07225, partial [Planctomycetaceae bacterium]|nr:hypothetical protein [Planctomycetaceae bacterium]